jgi:amino acid transporter
METEWVRLMHEYQKVERQLQRTDVNGGQSTGSVVIYSVALFVFLSCMVPIFITPIRLMWPKGADGKEPYIFSLIAGHLGMTLRWLLIPLAITLKWLFVPLAISVDEWGQMCQSLSNDTFICH